MGCIVVVNPELPRVLPASVINVFIYTTSEAEPPLCVCVEAKSTRSFTLDYRSVWEAQRSFLCSRQEEATNHQPVQLCFNGT